MLLLGSLDIDYNISIEAFGKFTEIADVYVVRLEPVGNRARGFAKFCRNSPLGEFVHPHEHVQETQAGALGVQGDKFFLVGNRDSCTIPFRLVLEKDNQLMIERLDNLLSERKEHIVFLEEECQRGMMTDTFAFEITEVDVQRLHEVYEELKVYGGPGVVALEAAGVGDFRRLVRLLRSLYFFFHCFHTKNRNANSK